MLQGVASVNWEKFAQKLSASVVYAILSAVAVNFFFQPGHIYSSGMTGMAQILTTVSKQFLGLHLPVALTLYLLNVPLALLAWFKIGKRFTLYTILTVSLSSLVIQILPEVILSRDPVVDAIFGGAVMGAGVGYALRMGISSGGLDVISLYIRRKTGRQVGRISFLFNLLIMLIAGILFGWQYALYSMMTIFVSSQVTDAVFTKQKKLQVTIVTEQPQPVTDKIHEQLGRGVTVVNSVEGGYSHQSKTILITVITRAELAQFKDIMREMDPMAFITIAENVITLGKFAEKAE